MNKKIIFDIKAWLITAALLPLGIQSSNPHYKWILCTFTFIAIFISFYAHKWLLNKFLYKNKKWQYLISLILLLALGAYIASPLLQVIDGKQPLTSYLDAALGLGLIIFFSTAISLAYKGIILQIQYEKTKRRQVEAELKLLQSQVNPHFLFNTLNNIYSQNLQNHADANEMILQLADLMRYQIESSKKNEVNIHDEIEFLHNYIALEKQRLHSRFPVNFTVENKDDLDFNIPPMLFIPFVENAFKHGIGVDNVAFIDIKLKIELEQISFTTENPIPLHKRKMESTNTGIENIQKRLELLFGEKHTLNISTNDQTYKVQLDIKI